MVNLYRIINLIIVFFLIGSGGVVYAVSQNFYFLSLQTGDMDTETPPYGFEQDDGYLDSLAKSHGAVKEDRIVQPLVMAFDFYRAFGSVGSGFGVDIHRYDKTYSFQDGSTVTMGAVGVLYGLYFYYRGTYWYPYFGFGAGTYSVKIDEDLEDPDDDDSIKTTIIDSASYTFHYKAGIRFPLGGWGIVLTWHGIAAEIKVETEKERIQLGGQAQFVGVYYGF